MRPLAIIGALLCAVLAASAQEKKTEMKPQKEHDALRAFEGKWDVKCKWMMPGKEVEENTGTESGKLGFNGFWLVSDFRGEFDKKPFHGMSVTGYDPQTKKYVCTMFGSHSSNVMKLEGEGDGKKWTFKGDCPDPATGKSVPHRVVWEVSDKDHRTEKVFMTGEDGKETQVGEFTYTRRTVRTESK